jgi:hypothetical protein
MNVLVELLFAGVAGGTTVIFLARSWIEARLTASIKHEYDQQLENFKRELDKRQKVELLAEMFAEWPAIPPGEVMPKERRTRMNQLSFAAAIWLPASVVKEMGKVLQLDPSAKCFAEILLLARKELIGDESLSPQNISYWGVELEKKGQPLLQRGA